MRPGIGVSTSTCRSSASSAAVANSNRNRLMNRFLSARAGAESQALAQIDVVMGTEIQSQVDADQQQATGVRLEVVQTLEDRTPAVELPAGVQAERFQLAGRKTAR